jgi:hypothetical protein
MWVLPLEAVDVEIDVVIIGTYDDTPALRLPGIGRLRSRRGPR